MSVDVQEERRPRPLSRPWPLPAPSRPRRVLRAPPAWMLAAALAALYLLLDPPSADLAAQTYRTWLFEQAGTAVWDNGWYAGHHLPSYSILFPPLAAVLGPRVVGALSAVATAWLAERLLGPRGRPAALWFATATAVSLVSGRLTFALGLTLGTGALLALARRRIPLAVLLSALTPLASPVAAAFLALLAGAWWLSGGGWPRRRRLVIGAALAGAAIVPVLVLGYAFPGGGTFPFAPSAFWPSLGATALTLALLPRERRLLRTGAWCYAALLVVSFAVPTPMGGNAVRLGALLVGPVATLVLWPRRKLLLLALTPAMLYWQWQTPVDDWVQASGDASIEAPYYEGVARFLESRGPTRVEVPFTDQHWEASLLARRVPLARGWERQLDRKVNGLFYRDELTSQQLHRWVHSVAVGYIALHDAPMDYSGAREAALVRSGLPWLTEVWHDAHWRVFAVKDPTPLAAGATVTRLGIDDVAMTIPRAGRVTVRVRWSPYWRLEGVTGCVRRDGDWTRVDARSGGRARLVASFSLARVLERGPRCT